MLAERLQFLALEYGARGPGQPALSDSYDAETCAVFAESLGDTVVEKAETFFGILNENGEVGSLELTDAVGVKGPTVLPFVLTTPLKRRAKALGLTRPWTEDASADNRTIWRDRDGIAKRMVEALEAERERRASRSA
jgi:hypothetical protein